MHAFAFDLGDTLVEYEGVPLNWVDYYPEALGRLANFIGVAPSAGQIGAAGGLLRLYNTRLNPREKEVAFGKILEGVCECFGTSLPTDQEGAARAFFSVFRQRLRCFPDSAPTLTKLKARGHKVGIFTDAAYGMPRFLIMEDIIQAGLGGMFDLVLTSVDAGIRKPSPLTLAAVAEAMGSQPSDFSYVGNERKDIEAAQAFGCAAILLDREGDTPAWGQTRTITSLAQLIGG